jgi:uncharacterized integral membrane protein
MRRHEEDDSDGGNGQSGPTEPRRAGITPRHVFIFLVAVVLVIFAVVNFKPVNVNFLLFSTRARVITVVVVSAILGFIIGYFVGRPGRFDRKVLRDFRERKD